MIDYAINKLTELLIMQSIKDKKGGRVECISKVQAYTNLIKILKTIKE